MIRQWLLSRTVRDATNLCKHVRKIVNEQRDLQSPQAIDNVSRAVGEVRNAIALKADPKALRERMANLEQAPKNGSSLTRTRRFARISK